MAKKKDDFTDDIDYGDINFDSLDADIDSDDNNLSDTMDKPPGKRKPFTDFSVGVAEGFKPSAANFKKVTHHIGKSFPKTGSLIDSSIDNISEVKRMGQEVARNVAPSLNRLKLTTHRFLPKVEGILPKKIYEKLDEKLGKPGYSDDRMSQEEIRDSAIKDQLTAIFNTQQQDQKKRYVDDKTKEEIDRQVRISEHSESTTIFSQIRNILKSNQVFYNTTFKGYMMKSLELQFQNFFVAKDMFDVSKGTLDILDNKLEQIKVNTGLPEVQKKHMSEVFQEYKRARTYGAMGEKLGDTMSNYGKKFMSNIKNKIMDGVENKINDFANMGSEMGDMILEGEEMKKDMDEAPTTATNVAGQLFGSLLSNLAIKSGIAGLKKATGNRHLKIDDIAEHLKIKAITNINDKTNNSDNWFWKLVGGVAPKIEEERGNIENVLARNATDDISFDVLTRRSIVEIMPGYLAKILQQNTLTNSLLKASDPNLPDIPLPDEIVYDKDREDFTTAASLKLKIEDRLFGSLEKRTDDINPLVNKLYSSYTMHQGSSKEDFKEALPDIVMFLNNLSKHVKVVNPDAILKYLKGETIDDNEELYLEWIFKDISDDNRLRLANILAKSFFKDINSDKLEVRNKTLRDLDINAHSLAKQRDSMIDELGDINVFGTKRHMSGLMEERSEEQIKKYKERLTKEALVNLRRSKGSKAKLSAREIEAIDQKVLQFANEHGLSHEYIRKKNADVDYELLSENLDSDETKKYRDELEKDIKPLTKEEFIDNSKKAWGEFISKVKKKATDFLDDEEETPIPVEEVKEKKKRKSRAKAKMEAPKPPSETEKLRAEVEDKLGEETKSHDSLNVSGPGLYVQGSKRELHMPLEKAKVFWENAAESFRKALNESDTLKSLYEVTRDSKDYLKESFTKMIKYTLSNSEAFQKASKFTKENLDKGKDKAKDLFEKSKTKFNEFKKTDKRGFINQKRSEVLDFFKSIFPDIKKSSSFFSKINNEESPIKDKGFNSKILRHLSEIKKILKSSYSLKSQTDPEIVGSLLQLLSANGIYVGGRFKRYMKNAIKFVGKQAGRGMNLLSSGIDISKDFVKGVFKKDKSKFNFNLGELKDTLATRFGNKIGKAPKKLFKKGKNLLYSTASGGKDFLKGIFKYDEEDSDNENTLATRFGKRLGKGTKDITDFGLGLIERLTGVPFGILQTPKGIIKRISDIVHIGLSKQDKFIDVYLKDEVKPGKPLITAQQQIEGKVIFADGTPIKNSRDIKQPVINSRSKNVKISMEHIEKGLVDINNKPLIKKLSLLQLGKKAFNLGKKAFKLQVQAGVGAAALGINTVATGAKKIWDKLRRNPEQDPSIPKESLIDKFKRYSKFDFKTPEKYKGPGGFNFPEFNFSIQSKTNKKLDKIIDILNAIGYGIGVDVGKLFKDKFTSRLKNVFRKDHLEKEKKRDGFFSSFSKKTKDLANKLNPFKKGNPETGEEPGIGRKLLTGIGSGIAESAGWQMAKAGIGTVASVAGGAIMSGAGAIGSGALAAGGFLLTNPVGWAVLGTGAAIAGGVYAYNKIKDSRLKTKYRKLRLPLYGAGDDLIDQIADLEEEVNTLEKGQILTEAKIKEYAKNFGFDPENKKHMEYFSLWFSKRFSLVFDVYRHGLKTHQFEFKDEDAIPEEAGLKIIALVKKWIAPQLASLSKITPYPNTIDGIIRKEKAESKIKSGNENTKEVTKEKTSNTSEIQKKSIQNSPSNVVDMRTRKPIYGPTVDSSSSTSSNIIDDSSVPTIGYNNSNEIGSISAKNESGSAGDAAIGYDKNGGTSYGKYQIASKTGTFNQFVDWLFKQGPTGIAIAEELKAAGNPNTGSRKGAVPDTWRKLANEGQIGPLSHKFIKETHFDQSFRMLSQSIRGMVNKSKTLQEVLWSSAVQHGPHGAARVFKKAYKDGMTDTEFIQAVYANRAGRLGKQTPKERAAVMNRFKKEQTESIGMVVAEKYGNKRQATNEAIKEKVSSSINKSNAEFNAPIKVASNPSISKVIPISKAGSTREEEYTPSSPEPTFTNDNLNYLQRQIVLLESIDNQLKGINTNVGVISSNTGNQKEVITTAVDNLTNKLTFLFKDASLKNASDKIDRTSSQKYRNVDDNYKPQFGIDTAKKRVAI